ncbi:hypothetical protein Tco_0196298 [Tanacetum coccineum]
MTVVNWIVIFFICIETDREIPTLVVMQSVFSALLGKTFCTFGVVFEDMDVLMFNAFFFEISMECLVRELFASVSTSTLITLSLKIALNSSCEKSLELLGYCVEDWIHDYQLVNSFLMRSLTKPSSFHDAEQSKTTIPSHYRID